MHLTGSEIRERREEIGLSQTTLAKEVGISRQYLIKIESGKAENVGDDIMTRFLSVLKVDCADVDLEAPVDVQIAKLRAGNEAGQLSIDDRIRIGECILARNPSESCIADLSLMMAPWYTLKARYREAMHCGFIASEYYSKTSDRIRWAKAYFEKANIEYCRGNFSTALERMLLIETRLIGTSANDDPIIPRVVSSIAVIAAALHDYEMMAKYTKKCESLLDYVPESSRRSYNAKNWYLRGEAYLKEGAYKDAQDAFSMSYCLYADLNDNINALRMRNNIAEAQFKAGDLDAAEATALEVLEQKRRAGESQTIIAETAILLAEIAHAKDDADKALSYANEVIEMEELDEGRRARAMRVKARTCFVSGDLGGFNRIMTEAVQMLTKLHIYLKIEMMEEYMIANNLPMSLK